MRQRLDRRLRLARQLRIWNDPRLQGPSGHGGALQIVSDRKGNLWYGELGTNAIVKFVRRRHAPIAYPIPATNAKPEGIAIDPRRHIWFTEWNYCPGIARLGHRKFTQYKIAALKGARSQAVDMILGSDKRIWFTTGNHGIGAHGLTGAAKLYAVNNNAESPTKLAVSPDKDVCFHRVQRRLRRQEYA